MEALTAEAESSHPAAPAPVAVEASQEVPAAAQAALVVATEAGETGVAREAGAWLATGAEAPAVAASSHLAAQALRAAKAAQEARVAWVAAAASVRGGR